MHAYAFFLISHDRFSSAHPKWKPAGRGFWEMWFQGFQSLPHGGECSRVSVNCEPPDSYQPPPRPELPNSLALELNSSPGLVSNEHDDSQLQPWNCTRQKLKESRDVYLYIKTTCAGRSATFVGGKPKKKKNPSSQAGMLGTEAGLARLAELQATVALKLSSGSIAASVPTLPCCSAPSGVKKEPVPATFDDRVSETRLPRKQALRQRFAYRKFIRKCFPEQKLEGRKPSSVGQQEKSKCDAVAIMSSANPRGPRDPMVLHSCPESRQWG